MNQAQLAAQFFNLRQKESKTWTLSGMKGNGKTA